LAKVKQNKFSILYFWRLPDLTGLPRFADSFGGIFYPTVLLQILGSFFVYNTFTAILSKNILSVALCEFLYKVCKFICRYQEIQQLFVMHHMEVSVRTDVQMFRLPLCIPSITVAKFRL
jgi:hypothetical protein